MVAEPVAALVPLRRRRRLSLLDKFAYASGNLETAIVTAAGVTTLVYYNQLLGVPAALCGTAFLIASLVDAFVDPTVGAWSDSVRTRWGRRHPFMFAAAFLIPIAFFCLYMPPSGLSPHGDFAWLTIFLVALNTSKAIFLVPHSALGAELTDDYHDRTAIFGWNYIVGSIGGAGLSAFVLKVMFPSRPHLENGLLDQPRYLWLAGGGAILCFLAVLGCTLATAKQIPWLHKHTRGERHRAMPFGHAAWTNLKALARNPSYVSICVCWLILAVSGGILGVVSTYTFLYALGMNTEQLSIRSLMILPGSFLAVPIAAFLVRWLDKKYTVIATIATTTTLLSTPFAMRLLGLLPPNGSEALAWTFFVFWALGYLTLPIVPIVIESQLVDVADEHELRTGNRAEGQIFAIRTFAIKLSTGLGGFLGGMSLQLIGFPQHAHTTSLSQGTIDGLLWLNGPIYWLIVAAGIGFCFLYRIDRKRHAQILAELEARRADP
jgi:Na+/melibiose symporter-like transporter